MNHTKEPWEARRDPSYYGIVSEVYAGDKFILGTGGVHSPSELEANTKRIVACVNACAGITNEALEKGVIKEAMELFWIVSDKAILNENNQMTYKGDIVFASDKEEDV